jgi:hypothetical protein
VEFGTVKKEWTAEKKNRQREIENERTERTTVPNPPGTTVLAGMGMSISEMLFS